MGALRPNNALKLTKGAEVRAPLHSASLHGAPCRVARSSLMRASQLIAVFSGRHRRGKGPKLRSSRWPIVLALFIMPGRSVAAVPVAEAASKTVGSICLVPVAAPNTEEGSLANPTGGNPEADYAVQLDARPAVRVKVVNQARATSTKQWIRDYPEGTLLPDVAVGTRHTIVVHHKGKPIESFRFRIPKNEPDQCLFLKELYLTWNLWPRASAPWCKCPAVSR